MPVLTACYVGWLGLIFIYILQSCSEDPSYGELIDLLDAAEIANASDSERSVAEILTQMFNSKYPHIPVIRQSRFLDTVRRVAAPTKPSSVGQQKLVGSPLASYRHRRWFPRIRHKQGTCHMDWSSYCF